jgi:hypothetical protein
MSVDVSSQIDTFTEAVGEMIADITGLDVYEERTNFTQPDGEYATLYISSYEEVSQDSTHLGYYTDDDDIDYAERAKYYYVFVTVKTYKGTPRASLLSIVHGLEMPEYRLPLYEDYNIGFLKHGSINDVSSVIDESWEQRASILLEFNFIIDSTDAEEAEEITSIEITAGDVIDLDDSVIYTIESLIEYTEDDSD